MGATQHILVTSGAGYIGSHSVLALLQAGHDVSVPDNLANSSADSLNRVAQIAGRAPRFVNTDIRNPEALHAAFAARPVNAVTHFAGLKGVGESVQAPLRYYDNNVAGTRRLCEVMARFGVLTLVFSSSATVEPAGPFESPPPRQGA